MLEHGPSVGAAHNSTSARNSEVVHAGIYYPEGSLKAACCVAGGARSMTTATRAG